MCGLEWIALGAGAGASLMQGLGGMQAGSANAAMAKRQGQAALYQSQAEAGNLAQRGAYHLGGMRRAAAGSGNLSAVDLIADSASALSLDVERVKHGGRAAKADADAQAGLYRWQGRSALMGGLFGAAVGAGTQLLAGLNTPSLESRYPVLGTARSMMPSLAGRF